MPSPRPLRRPSLGSAAASRRERSSASARRRPGDPPLLAQQERAWCSDTPRSRYLAAAPLELGKKPSSGGRRAAPRTSRPADPPRRRLSRGSPPTPDAPPVRAAGRDGRPGDRRQLAGRQRRHRRRSRRARRAGRPHLVRARAPPTAPSTPTPSVACPTTRSRDFAPIGFIARHTYILVVKQAPARDLRGLINLRRSTPPARSPTAASSAHIASAAMARMAGA